MRTSKCSAFRLCVCSSMLVVWLMMPSLSREQLRARSRRANNRRTTRVHDEETV
jgi:hypothetical protein